MGADTNSPATAAPTGITDAEAAVLDEIGRSRDRLIDLLQELVAFPTANPPGENENDAQEWMAAHLAALGMNVDTFDALPGRANVVGRLPGRGGGRSCMFNGHIDVAELRTPDAWNYPPYAGVVENDRMYGLGTSDMKSAHAGFLLALEALRATGSVLAGDVVYESVIGEETGEPGTRACVERNISADFAIVGECSKSAAVFSTSVGLVNACITLSDPITQHLIQRRRMLRAGGGLDAANCIEKMATKIVPALLDLEQRWGVFKSHPRLPDGQALINVFGIEGGGNTFIIPNECRAYVTAVYLPGERVEDVKQEIVDHLAAVAATDTWLAQHPPQIEWNPARYSFEFLPIDGAPGEVGAALLAQCLTDVSGHAVEVGGRDAIMDGGWLYEAGIPTAVFGPGDKRVIHAPNEYVEIDDVITFSKTVTLFLLRWCGSPERGA